MNDDAHFLEVIVHSSTPDAHHNGQRDRNWYHNGKVIATLAEKTKTIIYKKPYSLTLYGFFV
jgi:hypothetical protein